MSKPKVPEGQVLVHGILLPKPPAECGDRWVYETTLTIADIRVSPLNARRNHQDANATAAIEASILAEGLIHAINIHPMRAAKTWGAFAGGRRYRSIKKLIDRSDLPTDWPIKVKMYIGYSDLEIYEMSLSENISRRDLRMYEVVAGMRYLHAEGRTVAQIAKVYGQEEIVVLRWLRIGQLAKPIFDSWANEQITEDIAKAFAATEDQDLQLAVFAQFNQWPLHLRIAGKIHEALKVGDQESARLLRFVGDDVYRDAGGRWEFDLFAEDPKTRGRVEHPEILLKLVEQGLATTRDALRVRTGRPDLRFVPKPPVYDGGTDYSLMVRPTEGPRDTLELPEGDIVAELGVGDNGKPSVSWWWASRRAKFGTPKPAAAKTAPAASAGSAIESAAAPRAAQEAVLALKEDEGLSQNAVQILRTVRRSILRAAFVQDARDKGSVAIDYLVFAQLRMIFNSDAAHRTGMRKIVAETALPPDNARDFIDKLAGGQVWHMAVRDLMASAWMTRPDWREAFAGYRKASRAMKDLAAAVVAGAALERSLNAPGYASPMHEAVGAELGLDDDREIRRHWEPSEDLLKLFGRAQLLAIAEPLVVEHKWSDFVKLKTIDLANRLRFIFTQETQWTRRDADAAARTWAHPLLRFVPVEDAPADDAAALQEAAE